MNVSKRYEIALKAAMVAAGLKKSDIFFNAFQVPEVNAKGKPARWFPQIQYAVSPDTPTGHNAPFRSMSVSFAIITHSTDDPKREKISGYYEKLRAMIDAANTDPDTWTSTYLTAGHKLESMTIEEAAPPYFDEDWAIVEIPIRLEVCVE